MRLCFDYNIALQSLNAQVLAIAAFMKFTPVTSRTLARCKDILIVNCHKMQLLFTAPSLTPPTFETLQEYGSKRFEKLARFLPKFNAEPSIKISVQKEGYLFVVHVEVAIPKVIIVTIKDADLRKAIDYAYATLKKTVVRQVEKARGR